MFDSATRSPILRRILSKALGKPSSKTGCLPAKVTQSQPITMPKDAGTTERDARREMVAVCCAIAMRKTTPPKNLTAWGKQLFWLKLKKHKKK